MTFGLTFEKLLLIGLIAVLIIGPERLPRAAESFSRMVRKAGEYLRDTKSRMRQEMGPEIDDVDWRKLDPRQYDPRRIIRDALFEEPQTPTPTQARQTIAEPVAPRAIPQEFSATNRPPFDPEAT
ncbi:MULTISPECIES: twin-arginine translocase TatA/TatE family subunit [unclassified Microbacterium]|uniref:twin-arginine translocase TatA/TatE family subunit n=1 Tax=unclassified Microbacterium TaxID=2609290 RepID=UPI0016050D95|nr:MULTISPECIES: twin-arginine translocase TatA/TatE family subunit [unclassified Microbacterium]QNA92242.1 Sec-independent protein translocase TatB [Microbacterium sp. Se63.02b]QYM65511.1 twin-arginine translocase TatA/TatE family subunit [Microbacterium sp. Se5.02b]